MSKKEYEELLSQLQAAEFKLSESEKCELGLTNVKQISDSDVRKKYCDIVRKSNRDERGADKGVSFESWVSGGVERMLNDTQISGDAKTNILLCSLGNRVY